jgi:hypothetical protein
MTEARSDAAADTEPRSSTNQRQTEPVPPTPGHDVPGPDRSRADAGAGTSSGPGPREGSSAGAGGSAGLGEPYPQIEGRPPEASRPTPSGAGDVTQGPHDPGRVRSDLPGTASHVPGVQGDSPEPFGVDTAEGARRTQDAVTAVGADSGGDAKVVPVPSGEAAEGTSEQAAPVDGVRITALAREGLADGEPDNRTPGTTTF